MRDFKKTEPENVGMSSEALGRVTETLQQAVADRPEIGPAYPHCRVTVVKSGKLVYDEQTTAEGFEAPTEDSIYRWYSMTKIVTSVAIMQCYEKGLLSLNDPISKFIPAFADTGVFTSCTKVPAPEMLAAMGITEIPGEISTEPQATPVTVKMLLNHTAGLGYGGLVAGMGVVDDVDLAYMTRGFGASTVAGGAFGTSDDYNSLEGVCNILAKLPLKFQPGTKFEYGIGHFVSGRIIEVVTGLDFFSYLEKEIFKVLDMSGAGFGEDAATNKDLLKFYCYGPNELTGTPFDIDHTLTPSQRGVAPYIVEKAGNLVEVGTTGTVPPNLHFDHCKRPEFIAAVKAKKAPISGDAGMTGKHSDYFKFMCMLINRGVGANGARVLGAKSIELMFQNHLPEGKHVVELENRANPKGFALFSDCSRMAGMGYGLGGAVPIGDEHQTIDGSLAMPPGSYSWSGAAGTDVIIDPKNDIAMMFATQVMFSGFNPAVNGACGNGMYSRKVMAALL